MATSETAASIRESPHMTSRSVNPFVSRHGVELFRFYQNDRKRAGRFASAMAGIGKMERQFEDLRGSYAWDKIAGSKVIDVGGGNGHMSIALARTFPNLELVVEDSLARLSQASQQDLSDLNGRVAFLQHIFFEPQPITEENAYLLRCVNHNWSDEDCIQIFKAMVPVLEKSAPETPFLINDIILPNMGEASFYHECRLRQLDIMMMVVLGGKQRRKQVLRGCSKKPIHAFGSRKYMAPVI
ncbi:S-adenosyl-L-methionine-dependent methyltransferase [Massarina eburnea CBS 473.64]|uniref:S-adenosyl-L-methionine-dependent methyltransferase n=1 Tax=Massarina eburnea CBS 473.64 TaxID=1395130 RepID=A0A6A6S3D3_9PLEO|nr:S-adenosyl-L-methionine-dependent methyltransferase [Massarina eburnea CBS 473.64]